MNFKCHNCFTIIPSFEATIEVLEKREIYHCPECCNVLEPMCELDCVCKCNGLIQDGTRMCPLCGKFMCRCNSHDVEVVSRTTGYLSSVSSWNQGKRIEFLDRKRVELGVDGGMHDAFPV
jgi:hypothetical protein